MKREVLNQLKIVLDENGNPRACTRENTEKAMDMANEIFPGMNYGDHKTGRMNVKMLYLLKQMLELELEE